VSNHISKHLEVRRKYSVGRHIFNSLLGVSECGQTWSLVFDVLHNTPLTTMISWERYNNKHSELQRRMPETVHSFKN